ncbi:MULTISPECIES: hypothetical protein [unclassified Okeania]|nr:MULTISPECIES: hypothetical protein [unclassified Okeania]
MPHNGVYGVVLAVWNRVLVYSSSYWFFLSFSGVGDLRYDIMPG